MYIFDCNNVQVVYMFYVQIGYSLDCISVTFNIVFLYLFRLQYFFTLLYDFRIKK